MIYHKTQRITVINKDEKAEIICDMQPISGELAQKEYGLEVERATEIFADPCTILTEGARVALNDEKAHYIVKYTEKWDDYVSAVLVEIPQAVQDDTVDNENGENGMSEIYGGGFY